ncbi:MAG: DUF2306 domain-containing protein [Ekhidna sp.]
MGKKIIRTITAAGWVLLILLSAYFFYESVVPYIVDDLAPRKAKIKPFLIAHFVGVFCTIFLGPIQFWPTFRKRYLHLHRLFGKAYIIGSLIGALMVFYLLFNGYPLMGAIPSLFVLACLWIFVLVAAWYCIKKMDIKNHQHFMIRSYVLGLAFVFIRLLNRLERLDFNPFSFIPDAVMRDTLYEWMCWIFPLLITEIVLVWWPAIRKNQVSRTR